MQQDTRNPEVLEKQGDTFDAPIPGQALTTPEGGQPHERPPEETDPKKLLAFAIKRLNEPKVKEQLMDLLLAGIPIEVLVKNITKAGFMEGKFSPDIAELLQPPLTMYMLHLAKQEGIPAVVFMGENESVEAEDEYNQKMLGVMNEQRPELARSMRTARAQDDLRERGERAEKAMSAKEEIRQREIPVNSDGSFLEMEN